MSLLGKFYCFSFQYLLLDQNKIPKTCFVFERGNSKVLSILHAVDNKGYYRENFYLIINKIHLPKRIIHNVSKNWLIINHVVNGRYQLCAAFENSCRLLPSLLFRELYSILTNLAQSNVFEIRNR